MTKYFLALAVLYFSQGLHLQAQIKALTEEGDEVYLLEDGTWHFVEEKDFQKISIAENSIEFIKNTKATFPVKSKKTNQVVYLNPKEWTFFKSENNPSAEYEFRHVDDEIYGIIINEKFEIPIEALKDIAVSNAKKVAPDTKVEALEYRIVNGKKLIAMKMIGTVHGLKLFYFGYYYSSSSGSTQLLAYTIDSIKERNLQAMEIFLNGLVGED